MNDARLSAEELRPVLDALDDFGTAAPLLSFADAGGHPFSVPVAAAPDADGTWALKLPDALPLPPGEAVPASLLWHVHDEALEGLRSILLRGRLVPGASPVFEVTAPPTTSGVGTTDWNRMFARFERNAEGYLRDYGLTPPEIDWAAFERLAAEAGGRD
ncbi:hypothetical protein [Nonomuraea typhae]|uniref:hypothetical protein n=1 Tax=Nonomuraea typhae TaxID=2603600 RepID=UPI0012F9A61E|nr:hypothetical protein [Nonomuraea typhae]